MEASVARTELAKFLKLSKLSGRPLNMWSPPVDKVWHELLASPSEYESFCMSTLGQGVIHAENKGRGYVDWIAGYSQTYEEDLPSVWFAAADGSVDLSRMEEYLWTGEVYASWDCHPLIEKDQPDPKELEGEDQVVQ